MADAHTHTTSGSFGVYGPGAFVEYVSRENRSVALEGIRELEVRLYAGFHS